MKLHHKIAHLFGYELIKYRKHPSSNSHLINLINYCQVDLVLDVGANTGQFGKLLREEGFKGEIHSFEPVSATFEELVQVCATDDNWLAHKIALSDVAGRQTVNVSKASDLSSFLVPNEIGKTEFEKIELSYQESVDVVTLDEFVLRQIPDFENRKILLKMDTQGYDLKVVHGASNSLPHIACILSEISLIPIYEEMPHYLEALKQYEQYGFVVTGFYPISRMDNLAVIEMDCMLINQNQVVPI